MTGAGSVALQLRIEQQQHWQLAAAVRDGRQPGVDPDSYALRELRGNDRFYQGENGAFAKQLVGGAWSRVELS
jgi:RecB family exonuclease